VTILSSRWLPAVLGDFEPTWHSIDDYGAFTSMLMRHMNSIAEILIEEPEAFEPMFLEHIWKGKAVMVVDEWCEGYMRGVGLAADEWRAGTPEITDLLAPIRAFTEETDWLAHGIADLEQVEKLRDAIAPNVRAMHAYWFARRALDKLSVEPFRRSAARVGRNDPCPCGSGKVQEVLSAIADDVEGSRSRRKTIAHVALGRAYCDRVVVIVDRWCCSILAPCIPSGFRCPVSRMSSCMPKSRLRNVIRSLPQRRRATSWPLEPSLQNS
jgi:uncharacterized protein